MIYLDTSALVRFFTGDDRGKANEVKKLLRSADKIFVPDVVFPEIEYVLTRLYEADRNEVEEVFRFLISRDNIIVCGEIEKAVYLYVSEDLDMADCIIAAHAFSGKLASFDKKLLGIEGLKSYW